MVVAARGVLEQRARSSVAAHREVLQARALLRLADGYSVRSTAAVVGKRPNTTTAWRGRLIASGGRAGGGIRPGRGRKPTIPAVTVEAIVADTLHTVPGDGSV